MARDHLPAKPSFALQRCGFFLLRDNLRALLLILIKPRVFSVPLISTRCGTQGDEQDSQGEFPKETPHHQRGPGCQPLGLAFLLRGRILYLNWFCSKKGQFQERTSAQHPLRGCTDQYRAARQLSHTIILTLEHVVVS